MEHSLIFFEVRMLCPAEASVLRVICTQCMQKRNVESEWPFVYVFNLRKYLKDFDEILGLWKYVKWILYVSVSVGYIIVTYPSNAASN
jgi:hypothetical protein